MPPERDILQLLSGLRNGLDADVSLESLAARSGWSSSHFHRAFHRLVGETPKQYTLRLRLERAAVRLLTGRAPIVRIAEEVGFASHAVFTRAFRRHFGRTPADYRATALAEAPAGVRSRHATVTGQSGPCIGLFHVTLEPSRRRTAMPMLSIERRELTEAPVLIACLRPARHELSTAIGEGVGKVYMHAQTIGVALAGHPFTRYLSTGPGLLTIEVGFKLAAAAAGAGDVEAGVLPGGPAAVGVHGGPYDTLAETYAAMERWMATSGLRPAGAPWEWYLTDPAEHPDPADWRTEVFWPVTL